MPADNKQLGGPCPRWSAPLEFRNEYISEPDRSLAGAQLRASPWHCLSRAMMICYVSRNEPLNTGLDSLLRYRMRVR